MKPQVRDASVNDSEASAVDRDDRVMSAIWLDGRKNCSSFLGYREYLLQYSLATQVHEFAYVRIGHVCFEMKLAYGGEDVALGKR